MGGEGSSSSYCCDCCSFSSSCTELDFRGDPDNNNNIGDHKKEDHNNNNNNNNKHSDRDHDEAPGIGSRLPPRPEAENEDEEGEAQVEPLASASYGHGLRGYNRGGSVAAPVCREGEIDRRRRRATYLQLLRSYDDDAISRRVASSLEDAKNAIASYKPGMWIERVAGTKESDYDIPKTTTLLLVGPRGSGKSNLVNAISRVFEQEEGFLPLPDRAQVSHNPSATQGTCFLQEYMISRESAAFCIYDTRSLSEEGSENYQTLKRWMTEGVRHGEIVSRDSDPLVVKTNMKVMARQVRSCPCETRHVNYVIFVVDGVSILKSINSEDKHYTDLLIKTFNYPFMAFKDNKPVVVVTHGDLLSLHERARVCTHLGELLGIPPTKQIFDIPGITNSATKLAVVDMLRYSLEHADRNVPFIPNYVLEGRQFLLRTMKGSHSFEIWMVLVEISLLCIFTILFLMRTSG